MSEERVWVEKGRYEDLLLMEQFLEDNGLIIQYEMFLDVLIQMGKHPHIQPQQQIIDITDGEGNETID